MINRNTKAVPPANETQINLGTQAFLVLFVACILGLAFQGTRGLWEPDEGRYTNVALEMMRSGDYLTPRRNHETLHVTKPPVVYWTLAASMKTFGKNEWAVRLPMALAFIFTIYLVFRLGESFTPERPWLPALIYAGSPLPFFAANIVSTDTLLTFAVTAAVLAFVRHRFSEASPRHLDMMWALFGLAFMIKGPPGLLPLLAIMLWQWRNGGIRILLRPLGLAAFLVIASTWFVLIIWINPELLRYFLHHEFIDRVASSEHHRNSEWYGGFLVYLPTLLLGAIPWLAFAVWRRRSTHNHGQASAETRFLLIWLILPLCVFMLSRSRLPLYILPLFVPISLILARAMKNIPLNKKHFMAAMIWLAVLVSVKGLAGYLPYKLDARAFAMELRPLLPSPAKEIVFIDSKAVFGLDFYLDVEIEKISLAALTGKPAISDAEFDQDMATEILEEEPGRYYLIPNKQMPALKLFLQSNDYRMVQLGKVGKFEVLAISPQ